MRIDTREPAERHAIASRLLAEAGFGGAFDLVPLTGGGNSKAFRVDLAAGAPTLFLKEYFQHVDDIRDRLGTEFTFASFAWQHGLRCVARPYAMARAENVALYSFLAGRKLEPGEITRDAVEQCLRFYRQLNAHKNFRLALALPAASEACFSLDDHWHCLARRIERLQTISAQSEIDASALDFILKQLAPASSAYLSEAKALATALGINACAQLSTSDRCLSPSDFGFHNALLSADGTLQFFDFEYAGWDDPAKTVCDFFCQLACPVPMQYYDEFADALAKSMSDPAKQRRRFDILLPMYQLKWCCIMLNDFLPSGGSRRRFALQGVDESERKASQLEKARVALACMRDPASGAA
jgi:thiamine kinase-like enzyme